MMRNCTQGMGFHRSYFGSRYKLSVAVKPAFCKSIFECSRVVSSSKAALARAAQVARSGGFARQFLTRCTSARRCSSAL